jgi:hypothetical protein
MSTKRSADEMNASNAAPAANKRARQDDDLAESPAAESIEVLKVYGLPEMVDFSVRQGAWMIRTSRLLLYQSSCLLFSGLLLPEQQGVTRLELPATMRPFPNVAAMVRFFDDVLGSSVVAFNGVTFDEMTAYVYNLDQVGLPRLSTKFQERLGQLVKLADTLERKEAMAVHYPEYAPLMLSLAADYVERRPAFDHLIPAALLEHIAPHLLVMTRRVKHLEDDVSNKAKRMTKQLEKVEEILNEFRASFIDEDEDGCDEDECVKSCAPGNRCAAHPEGNRVSEDADDYEICPLSSLNLIAKVLGIDK